MGMSKHTLIVTGDRVLIEPVEGEERTRVGLYLPQTVLEKETVQSGRIAAVGPGLPLPAPQDVDDEPWRHQPQNMRHMPMQAKPGDLAIYLKKASVEIKYENKTYVVVPQAGILILLRDNDIEP